MPDRPTLEPVAGEARREFVRQGAYFLSPEETDEVGRALVTTQHATFAPLSGVKIDPRDVAELTDNTQYSVVIQADSGTIAAIDRPWRVMMVARPFSASANRAGSRLRASSTPLRIGRGMRRLYRLYGLESSESAPRRVEDAEH